MKTCFVIIGFGTKTDLKTGEAFNLDKTFNNIIKPAFEEMGYECFRAIEKNTTGSIDQLMYQWIIDADYVVADISTLNPNVLYELGVRHAVKPRSTLIISEVKQMANLPFDINHSVILSYEHLGKGIDYDEVERFKRLLKDTVAKIEQAPGVDSPVYTFLPDLVPPAVQRAAKIIEMVGAGPGAEDRSLEATLAMAKQAKNDGNHDLVTSLLETASKLNPNDASITQQLALATYKSKKPDVVSALKKAREILASLHPDQSTDPETLGLAGAIDKRLYDATGDRQHLNRSLWFYEKGFYVKQDYYNGINAAFLHVLKAASETDRLEALASYGQANRIWKEVIGICDRLLIDAEGKKKDYYKDERVWIYLTLAEAHNGLGNKQKEEECLKKAGLEMEHKFAIESYNEQKQKLNAALEAFQARDLVP
jgi:Tetratricopeptide Repeats-Sensor